MSVCSQRLFLAGTREHRWLIWATTFRVELGTWWSALESWKTVARRVSSTTVPRSRTRWRFVARRSSIRWTSSSRVCSSHCSVSVCFTCLLMLVRRWQCASQSFLHSNIQVFISMSQRINHLVSVPNVLLGLPNVLYKLATSLGPVHSILSLYQVSSSVYQLSSMVYLSESQSFLHLWFSFFSYRRSCPQPQSAFLLSPSTYCSHSLWWRQWWISLHFTMTS